MRGNNFVRRLGVATLTLSLLSACGLITERGIYNGIRAQQKAKAPVGAEGAAGKQLPDYDQYQQQRGGVRINQP